MSRWYVDTSAALKLIVEEPESASLARLIDREHPHLVGSVLLETELRRAVAREPALTQSMVTGLLADFDLYELPPSLFREAGLVGGVGLRTLDALHVAAAIRLDVDAVVTYDRRLARAAEDLGLVVLAPGPSSTNGS